MGSVKLGLTEICMKNINRLCFNIMEVKSQIWGDPIILWHDLKNWQHFN